MSGTDMHQTCMWCSQEIARESASLERERESVHALCGCCSEHFSLPPSGPAQEYLDQVKTPVVMVELHAGTYLITRAVNRNACDWLGKEPREIIQHLIGNVVECAYARLREGCGSTVFCDACVIKQAVAAAAETGAPLVKAVISLKRGDPAHPSPIELSLTAMKTGRLVMLRMDTCVVRTERDTSG